MKTTLTCLEAGQYRVRRGTEKWAGRCSLLARFVGWEFVFTGSGINAGLNRVVDGFDYWRDAKAWIESDAGQRWLDQLPKAEGTP